MNRRSAFTLIELIVSVGLAMLLIAFCATAFFQVKRTANRLAIKAGYADRAQNLFFLAQRSFSAICHNGAMLVASDATAQKLDILFMRTNEASDGFMWREQAGRMRSDTIWELWEYRQATGELWRSTTSGIRSFQPSSSFLVNGRDYQWSTFFNLTRPRKELTAANWRQEMNNNLYFPATVLPTVDYSKSAWGTSDFGDLTDLERNQRLVLNDITAFDFSIVDHLGATTPFPISPSNVHVINGVSMDGRSSIAYATSEVARRPKLARLRFTIGCSIDGTPFQQTYTFSIPTGPLSPSN